MPWLVFLEVRKCGVQRFRSFLPAFVRLVPGVDTALSPKITSRCSFTSGSNPGGVCALDTPARSRRREYDVGKCMVRGRFGGANKRESLDEEGGGSQTQDIHF